MFQRLFGRPRDFETPDQVSDAALTALEAYPDARVMPTEDPLGWVFSRGGKEVDVNFHNLVAVVLNPDLDGPAQRHEIARFVETVAQLLQPCPFREGDLVVAVRHRDFVAGADGAIVRPLFGDLVSVLMLNAPDTLSGVMASDLAEAGLDEDAAWARAMENLQPILAGARTGEGPGGTRIVAVEDEPALGSSLLLNDTLFQEIRTRIGAETLLMAAPSRIGVEYIDARQPGALDALQRSVEAQLGLDHPQSACIYALSAGDAAPRVRMIHEDGVFRSVD